MTRVLMAVVAAGCLFGASLAKADPVPGKIDKTFVVQPGGNWKHTLSLYGDEWTRIRVTGDGSTKLTVQVFDEFGDLVISDAAGSGDLRGVRVMPRRTGKFTIKVTNYGDESNAYRLQID